MEYLEGAVEQPLQVVERLAVVIGDHNTYTYYI